MAADPILLNQDMPRGLGAHRLQAVIFDWAGTTVDFGSLAPVRTLERVFGEAGVPITEEEARRDMGIAKHDHIAAILAIARVRSEWETKRGRPAESSDVDILYERFMPLQLACLSQYSKVIHGVPEVVDRLRSRNIKVGSTTGYTRAMLNVLLAESAEAGYRPDCSFSPEDAGAGRPSPFMIYAAAIKMKVYPTAAILKVGDTASDIAEGLNAGAWSVGVAATGNGVGMSEQAFLQLDAAARETTLRHSRRTLQSAGAHYVVDTLADLHAVIDDVEARLRAQAR